MKWFRSWRISNSLPKGWSFNLSVIFFFIECLIQMEIMLDCMNVLGLCVCNGQMVENKLDKWTERRWLSLLTEMIEKNALERGVCVFKNRCYFSWLSMFVLFNHCISWFLCNCVIFSEISMATLLHHPNRLFCFVDLTEINKIYISIYICTYFEYMHCWDRM